MDKYESVFNNMITDIKDNIIINDNFKFEEAFKSCLINLEKNINDIQEKYYQSVYLNTYENFLEYPDEIVFKIEQYKMNLQKILK